jgi:hypothetical protein
LIDRTRSALVLALASDSIRARFNCLAFAGDQTYQPNSPAFRSYLFPWEEKVVAKYFPPPPARLLIGGAGGGREVLALARMGYEVVAFEPSSSLVNSMARRVADMPNVRVYRASYEDMPRLFPITAQELYHSLEAERGFDAAILGWCSFPHLRREDQRIQTLCAFARHVRGPILISFYHFVSDKTSDVKPRAAHIRKLLKISSGDNFSVHIGFTHDVSASELAMMAEKSGLSIAYLNEDSRDTNWPHAVLCPLDRLGEFQEFAKVDPDR